MPPRSSREPSYANLLPAVKEGTATPGLYRAPASRGDSRSTEDMTLDEQAEPVLVGTFPQPHDAHMAQMALESEGVDSFLEGEYAVSVNPLLSSAMGGVRLLVAASDAELAARILQEYRQERAEAEAKRARTCPRCSRGDGTTIPSSILFGILAVMTLGVLSLLVSLAKYKCPGCGHRWR